MPQLKVKARARVISREDMRKRIEKGNYKALHFIGKNVDDAARRGIGAAEPRVTAAGAKAVGSGAIIEYDGGLYRDLTMMGKARPRSPGKPIKSWGPERFMRNSIRADWDNSRKSIVIGTFRGSKIGRLHQYGGTLTLTAWRIGIRTARTAMQARKGFGRQGRDARGRFTTALPENAKYEYGSILWHHSRPRNARNWRKTDWTKQARYPSRPFMRGSDPVEKVIANVRERFRDTLPIGGSRAA